MKDSGIKWIGEIPDDLLIRKLKYSAKIKSGDSITNEQLSEDGLYEVYGGNGLVGYHNYYNTSGEKIIIGRVGALCGNVKYINENKYITDNALILTLNNGENYRYYTYVLFAADLGSLNTSNAQPLITGTKVLNVFVPQMAYKIQQRIANFLDDKCSKIDSTIEKETQVIEKLKAYKQSIITEAVTKGLNPNVPMKDSGIEWIGVIPEQWEIKRMKFVGLLSANGVDKKQQDGDPLFKSVHYMDVYRNSLSEIGNSENYLIISANDNKASSCTLKKGDVLFTNSSETPDDMGHSTVIKEDLEKTLFGYHLMRLRPKEEMQLQFEKYMFGCFYMRKWFEYRSIGMTRYGISYSDFAESRIIVPPLAEQTRIADYLDQKCAKIDNAIEQKQKLIDKLTEYEKSLIYEAVTGKIEV